MRFNFRGVYILRISIFADFTFLGAAAGSPYIVFITRFRRMASGHGYIYIYIDRYIYNVDAAVV